MTFGVWPNGFMSFHLQELKGQLTSLGELWTSTSQGILRSRDSQASLHVVELEANVPSTESRALCHPHQLESQTLWSQVANLTSAFDSSAGDR